MNSRMPQLVFDTNILVDALLSRGHYYQYAVSLLNDVDSGKVEGWYAPHCITTVYYLAGKTLAIGSENRADSEKRTRDLLKELAAILKPLPQIGDEILRIKDYIPGSDFEDELIVQLAQEYLPNPLLVTRDKWFLYHGQIKAAHPKEIVEAEYKPGINSNAGTAFVDLAGQQRALRPQLESRIHTVLHHGKYIMGPEIGQLESRLADYVGARHCITCSSGTDTLLMALMALDIGPGDAVFTSPFTFIATAEVIALLGATPIFVDVDPYTFNLDPDQLEKAIQAVQNNDLSIYTLPAFHSSDPQFSNSSIPQSLNPKCILPVDLFGLPADYNRINRIAQDNGLKVIEDAAQSLGAEYQGSMAGNLTHIGCTSFFPAKPLGGYGDGGAIFTDDDDLAHELKSIRVHGKGTHKYDNARIGVNGRLDTMQAAVLLAKLDIFPREIELRQQIAQRYTEKLRHPTPDVRPSFVPPGMSSAWAQYSLLAKDAHHRQALQARLKDEGIPSVVYYPKPLHQQSAFGYLGYKAGDMPASEDCAQRIFSLPMHPYLSFNEQDRICEVIRDKAKNG